ncbi:universal stress protein [Halobacteriales archaeon QS_4_69_225]|nr:MAG: universal stress protein [Halobacteriales archaeon QS_4_69_225]
MTLVVVPVRYPLSDHSRATLERAAEVAADHDADLTVLHVDLYQSDGDVTRAELKAAIEGAVGRIERARYVVRSGFLVEETILDEVAGENADYVVIGRKQTSRWRRAVRRLLDDPDVEGFLQRELSCEVITASP